MKNHGFDAVPDMIRSDRTSARTRAVLQERATPGDPAYAPAALSPEAFRTLRAVLDRVLPQTVVDVAQRVDRALAGGAGDGWRYADLPPDVDAYRQGLAALDRAAAIAGGFASLDASAQDALLEAVAAGQVEVPGRLGPAALQHWFEDVRGDAVKIYVAHPDTFARMGYGGFAYGGDGPRKQGFQALAPGAREPWEPGPGGGP